MHSSTNSNGSHSFISESAKVNTSWPEVRCVTVPAKAGADVEMDVYIGAAPVIEELFNNRHIHFKCSSHHGDSETLVIPAKEAASAIKLLMSRNKELAKAGSKKTAIEPEVAEAVNSALPH